MVGEEEEEEEEEMTSSQEEMCKPMSCVVPPGSMIRSQKALRGEEREEEKREDAKRDALR